MQESGMTAGGQFPASAVLFYTDRMLREGAQGPYLATIGMHADQHAGERVAGEHTFAFFLEKECVLSFFLPLYPIFGKYFPWRNECAGENV